METNDREIRAAIAGVEGWTRLEISRIADKCHVPDKKVRELHQGSDLSLMEIRQFATWRQRLPDAREVDMILKYGVGAMKTLFNQSLFKSNA